MKKENCQVSVTRQNCFLSLTCSHLACFPRHFKIKQRKQHQRPFFFKIKSTSVSVFLSFLSHSLSIPLSLFLSLFVCLFIEEIEKRKKIETNKNKEECGKTEIKQNKSASIFGLNQHPS